MRFELARFSSATFMAARRFVRLVSIGSPGYTFAGCYVAHCRRRERRHKWRTVIITDSSWVRHCSGGDYVEI